MNSTYYVSEKVKYSMLIHSEDLCQIKNKKTRVMGWHKLTNTNQNICIKLHMTEIINENKVKKMYYLSWVLMRMLIMEWDENEMAERLNLKTKKYNIWEGIEKKTKWYKTNDTCKKHDLNHKKQYP